jgi:hypothetical protein
MMTLQPGISIQGPVDTIEFDWPRATRRIANDPCPADAFPMSKPAIFESHWVCRRDHSAKYRENRKGLFGNYFCRLQPHLD